MRSIPACLFYVPILRAAAQSTWRRENSDGQYRPFLSLSGYTCRQASPEPDTAMAYVDGMNLYGAVKGRPCLKWLNIQSLLESLVPAYRIATIRYYTARIKRAYPEDEGHSRQRKYLDALSSLSKIDIRYGTYSRFRVGGAYTTTRD